MKRIFVVVAAGLMIPAIAMAAPGAAAPKAVTQLCATCHGPDGNGTTPPNPDFPKLAGSQPEYLSKQLKDFKSGKRKNEIMNAMVAALTPEDIQAISNYYSTQKAVPGTVKAPDRLPAGQKMHLDGNVESGVPSCAGCHEANAGGYKQFPRLAGQHSEYIYQQLKKFQTGERDNDKGLSMQSVAAKMSEAEMLAVAEYLTSLK